MLNIIKSQNYTFRRSKGTWITIASMLIIPLFIIMLICRFEDTKFSDFTPSFYYGSQTMAEVAFIFLLCSMILSCTAAGGDAGDKTINYELINGHSRNKVFFSRIIVGIGWGVLFVLVFNVIPLVYLSLINGWGDETSMRDVVLRSALAFFPIIRISTFSMLIATVARSKGKGLGYGYTIIMFWSLILSILDEFGIKTNYLGAEYDLMYLFVSEKTRNVVIGGKSVTIFDTAVSGDSMTKLIIVSLALSLVYIIVGFIYFKKTDRD